MRVVPVRHQPKPRRQTGAQGQLQLVVVAEAFVVERGMQLRDASRTFTARVVQGRIVDAVVALVFRGRVLGDLGMPDQAFRVIAMRRMQRDADADPR
jgi:hypothetical protein